MASTHPWVTDAAGLPPVHGRVAVIGTRRVTRTDADRCRAVGVALAHQGVRVVSGGAPGADQAFAEGVASVDPHLLEVVLPWEGFHRADHPDGARLVVYDPELHPGWAHHAAAAHPAWDIARSDGRPVLSPAMKRLHARNTGILLGSGPGQTACLVIACVAPGRTGGTEQGIRLAEQLEVPIVLLGEGPPAPLTLFD